MWARLHDGKSPDVEDDEIDAKEDDEEETTSQPTNLEEKPADGAVSEGGAASVTDGCNKRTQDEVDQGVPPSTETHDGAAVEKETAEPSNKKARVVPI